MEMYIKHADFPKLIELVPLEHPMFSFVFEDLVISGEDGNVSLEYTMSVNASTKAMIEDDKYTHEERFELLEKLSKEVEQEFAKMMNKTLDEATRSV